MKKVLLIVCGFALLASIGCGLSKPKAVDVPPYDPGKISAKAMELYDKNGDKKLDADELKACPGMLFSLKGPKSMDTNSDGAIDDSEIKTRIQGWIDMKVGLTCPIVKFVDNKGKTPKDVIGKEVVLTPDPLHDGMLKTTEPIKIDENGQCSPSTAGNIDNLSGMSYGFYTITINGASYKDLGVEIFDGAKEDDTDSFKIELKKGK